MIIDTFFNDPFNKEEKPTIMDGSLVATHYKTMLKEEIKSLKDLGLPITLAVIQVGDDPASSRYIRTKERACEFTGIKSKPYHLSNSTTTFTLIQLIQSLNTDSSVHGILVQLPLPDHINEQEVLSAIHPSKDVDGFHPHNAGLLFQNKPTFIPCTPLGIMKLLNSYNIEITGKNCVVVGRSNIVGKPIAMELLDRNGTVTICHSRTQNLKEVCKQADILICAIGKPRFFTKEFIKPGAVVIDVGINHDKNGKLCGDVDFDNVIDVVGAITPVPGGVGPMTVAMLMENCRQAAYSQYKGREM